MDLPIFNKLSGHGKEEPEYFLAIEINNSRVKSVVWAVSASQTEVVVVGSTCPWLGQDAGELVKTVDASLSSALQKLAESTDKQPTKVIFGLPEAWVSGENKIHPDKIPFLKDVTRQLELTPIGFVVTTEALTQYLKEQEGVPPSVLFVELHEEEIEVTFVNLGKIIGRELVSRSVDLGADVEEGLVRFLPQALFPSRMLLFNSHADLEDARQQLLNHSWKAKGSKLPFLHFPKVEILSEEETVRAVALAGGAEAAKAIGFTVNEKQPIVQQEAETETDKQTRMKKGDAGAGGDYLEEEVSQEESGMAPGEEAVVLEAEPPLAESAESAEAEPPTQQPDPEKFGFVTGQDISKLAPLRPVVVSPVKTAVSAGEQPVSTTGPVKGWKFPAIVLPAAFRVKLPTFGKFPGGGKWFKTIGGIVLLLIIGGGAGGFLWWNFASASVVLEVLPKRDQRTLKVTIDPKANDVDIGKLILPGKVVSAQLSGQKTAQTTGQKQVGTKATGTVTVYNNTSQPLDLKSGSPLLSETKLKFTVDSAVTIASASGTADNPSPGQGQASVTAGDVGPEYNLAGDSTLTPPGFSTAQVVAKNSASFAGGERRTVQAVSDNDSKLLISSLADDLTPQVKDELQASLSADEQLVGTVTVKTSETTFDKKVGDEGTSLSLQETVRADGLTVTKSALNTLSDQLMSGTLPQGYALDHTQDQINFGSVAVATASATKVEVQLTVVALPHLSVTDLANQLQGKNLTQADEILRKVPGFVRKDITLHPGLPEPFALLPSSGKRITVSVKLANSPL
jgi:hypothetical protein